MSNESAIALCLSFMPLGVLIGYVAGCRATLRFLTYLQNERRCNCDDDDDDDDDDGDWWKRGKASPSRN